MNGEQVDEQLTGDDGCYTWTNPPPLQGEDSYYDAEEATRLGWIALRLRQRRHLLAWRDPGRL